MDGVSPTGGQNGGAHKGDDNLTLPFQKQVKQFYEGHKTQMVIAGLIVSNFLVTCISKEIDPQDTKYTQAWYIINTIFNILFTIELVVNLYGRWWCTFWRSKWNWFDFVVVSIGIIDMAWTDMPGPLRLVRLLRAFRVFRLFSRVEAMRKVVESILRAVPGVMNAFLINFILICIYAVLSIDFFSTLYDDCKHANYTGPSAMLTARNECWGPDYYGTFTRALYTMFQVLTGESWSEAGARPAIDYYMQRNDVTFTIISYFFFYSFVIINSFVLLNVVVAVLMDGMNSAAPAPPSDGDGQAQETSDAKAGDDTQPGAGKISDNALADLRKGLADMRKLLDDQNKQMDSLSEEVSNLKKAVS